MEMLYRIYKRVMRYSTILLGTLVVVLGAYVYLTTPDVYYSTYCADPADVQIETHFDNAYDCDVEVINYMKTKQQPQCQRLGCKLVVD